MKGVASPGTLHELIDSIVVDISGGSKEVSVIDKSPKVPATFTSTSQCANCGATGEDLSKDCSITCKHCNLNFCPGARHNVVCGVCTVV